MISDSGPELPSAPTGAPCDSWARLPGRNARIRCQRLTPGHRMHGAMLASEAFAWHAEDGATAERLVLLPGHVLADLDAAGQHEVAKAQRELRKREQLLSAARALRCPARCRIARPRALGRDWTPPLALEGFPLVPMEAATLGCRLTLADHAANPDRDHESWQPVDNGQLFTWSAAKAIRA